MERKRELTKILLAESFKELLIKGSFENIRIYCFGTGRSKFGNKEKNMIYTVKIGHIYIK